MAEEIQMKNISTSYSQQYSKKTSILSQQTGKKKKKKHILYQEKWNEKLLVISLENLNKKLSYVYK